MKKVMVFSLFLLLLLCSAVALGDVQPCYWQLSAIETAQEQIPFNGDAAGSTSIGPATAEDPLQMMGLVSGSQSVRIQLNTTRNMSSLSPNEPRSASGLYQISGIPVIVPGHANAQLTVTSSTDADLYSYYLYATLTVNGKQVLRIRDDTSSVLRLSFPAQANPGDTYRITLHAQESNHLISQKLSYIYKAIPGYTLIDPSGSTLLYNEKGEETDRLTKTLKENLPNLVSEISGGDGVVFSSAQDENGNVVASFDPDSGLSVRELLPILRALQENSLRTSSDDTPSVTANTESSHPETDGSAGPDQAEPPVQEAAAGTSVQPDTESGCPLP